MEAISYLSRWITWLMLIIPVGAGARIMHLNSKKSMTDDEGTISDCNSKIGFTIKAAIIGVSISGIVTTVKAFYM